MTNQEAMKFWTRAKAYGYLRSKNQEKAEDFASYAVEQRLKNPNATNLEWLWIELFRKENHTFYGDENRDAKMGLHAYAKSLDAPVSQENDTTLHEVIAAPEAELELSDDDRLFELAVRKLREPWQTLARLRRLGLSHAELALISGRHPITISVKLRSLRAAYALVAVEEKRREIDSLQPLRLEPLSVAWVTL